jgi:hypothetical protein
MGLLWFEQFTRVKGRRGSGSWIYNYLSNHAVHITTKVVSSNPNHGEMYSIQHYMIKVYQWLATGQWFSPGTLVSSTNKTDRHDITVLLVKVALNNLLFNATFTNITVISWRSVFLVEETRVPGENHWPVASHW